MRRITFSALPRLFACPASHILPWVEDEEPSEFRDRGHAVHNYLQHFRELGPIAALEGVPEEHRAFCELIDADSLPTDLSTEVALAYNPVTRTARVLKGEFHRDYSDAKGGEICGTLDVLGLAPDMAYVSDYKTGWMKQPKASEHPQLLMGALCATRAFDKPSALIEVIEVREGKNWRDSAEVDAFDLLAFEGRVLALWSALDELDSKYNGYSSHLGIRRVSKLGGHVHPGAHCRYCPAFQHCPEQKQLALVATDGTLAAEVESWAGLLTATTAREAYHMSKAMTMLATRTKEIVDGYAAKNPIKVAGGRYYGLIKTPGVERLDGDVVWTQALRLFTRSIADVMVSRSTTKKAITAALRANKTSIYGTQKAALEELLEAVRDANGATRKPGTRMGEFEVKDD